MMKAKHFALGLLGAIALTSCGSTTGIQEKPFNDGQGASITELVNTLRKGYTVNGKITQLNRFYTNDDYNVINASLGTETKEYQFEYTYQNNDGYIGVDRNLYYIDAKENNRPRMIHDDNLFNKNGAVYMNTLFYDNVVEEMAAINGEENEGLNVISYGSSGLSNPFLNIETSDFTRVGENSYSINNDKISEMVLDMFVDINDMAFATPVYRNILTLDESSKGIDHMFIYLDEYKTTLTDGDAYNNIYCGQNFSVSLSFTDEGIANAKNKLTPYAEKAENKPLRTIFDKMEGQKLKTTRKDVTFYDDIEHTENYETIVNYFDGEKIFYQVYDAANLPEGPTSVTSSDFILLKEKENNLMRPYARNTDGSWSKAPQFNRIGGFEYKAYLPIIGEISENIFTYDKARDLYICPEYLATYFPLDGCLIPTMVVSSAIYQKFTNEVQVKLKDNGDIDYVRICCYFDAGSFVNTGYYEMTYEYGEQVKMPYGIDTEINNMNGDNK